MDITTRTRAPNMFFDRHSTTGPAGHFRDFDAMHTATSATTTTVTGLGTTGHTG